MELRKVPATRRNQSGKGPARRLRADGHIPAIAYSKELGSMQLAVAPKDLIGVLEAEHGRNSVIELDVEGGDKLTVLLSDFQYHPVSRELLHADFLQIHLDRPVEVDVPFMLHGKAKGVVAGGILRQVFRKLPIRCLPEQIPVKLEHDITELGLDEQVAAEDVAVPEGVEIRLPAKQTVAAVVTEKKRGPEEEEGAAAAPGAAAGEGAAPAAAAPEGGEGGDSSEK